MWVLDYIINKQQKFNDRYFKQRPSTLIPNKGHIASDIKSCCIVYVMSRTFAACWWSIRSLQSCSSHAKHCKKVMKFTMYQTSHLTAIQCTTGTVFCDPTAHTPSATIRIVVCQVERSILTVATLRTNHTRFASTSTSIITVYWCIHSSQCSTQTSWKKRIARTNIRPISVITNCP